jgi:hypothetical protein
MRTDGSGDGTGFYGESSKIHEKSGPEWIDHMTARMYLTARHFYLVCKNCDHTGIPDMESLVARGLGDTPLLDLSYRCSVESCRSHDWTYGALPPWDRSVPF